MKFGLKSLFFLLLCVCLVLPAVCLYASPRQEVEPAKDMPREIHSSPKNIKEEVAVYVFLGWMWLSIFVLIFLLRLKVKELDRLYQLRYFSVGTSSRLSDE